MVSAESVPPLNNNYDAPVTVPEKNSSSGLSYTPETLPESGTGGAVRKSPVRTRSAVWDGTSVYFNGVIYINKYEQLALIGTDTIVTDADFSSTVGSGNQIILSGEGTEEDPYVYLRYSNDAVYYLANDIPLPSRTGWSVPADFSGSFISENSNGKDNSTIRTSDNRVYSNGTIYYHNIYQMASGVGETVNENDYDAVKFDTGNTGVPIRYYNNLHDYVLASNFTASTVFDVTEYIDTQDSDGKPVTAIVIRDYNQLRLVGLGENVLSEDTKSGKPRTQTVNYPPDAVYYLANDITLADDGWQLPPDFTGSFMCDDQNYQSDSVRDYDRQTLSATKADIYIQNIYQLEMLGLDDSARSEEPYLDRDYDAAYFGTGSPVYLTELSSGYLTYGKSNTYILSRTFSNKRVDQIGTTVMGNVSNDNLINGRDFFGQTTVEVGGVTYILIGDRQQLDAIGTGKYVYDPVYKVIETRETIHDAWRVTGVELVYPGDADLIDNVSVKSGEADTADFFEASLFNSDSYPSFGTTRISSLRRETYCASDGKGRYNIRAVLPNSNRGRQRYTKDANYIIFRDINMNKTDKDDLTWNPLMFSGTMYGIKSAHPDDVSTLWSDGKASLNVVKERKPEIQNIDVVPVTFTETDEDDNEFVVLDLNKQTGVGFFGTLSGKMNSSSVITDPVIVKNIRLKDGTVNNPAVKAGVESTLVNDLLVGVADVLGIVLDPVLYTLIGKNVGTRAMLTGLLNARAKDPTSLATGGFAGRIIGNAEVEGCEVENISVTTVATNGEADGKICGKGEFVGHVEGVTTYDALSNTLDTVQTALSSLLNIIPGLGLGDLVTVLLDNALPVGDLIPTGYTSPTLTGCRVDNCTLSDENGKYGVGGFAGDACGTVMNDCSVDNCDGLVINADHFGGGFVGAARDAVIKGTLNGLGIEIAEALHPQTEMTNCSIKNSNITVRGNRYLGGFAGVLADSYAINPEIDEDSKITVTGTNNGTLGSGDYVGGFAGHAQLGSLFGLGNYLSDERSLLSTVTGLVTGLLGDSNDQSLLDLGGVAPSAIMGCQLDGELTVSSGGSYVGGIVGKGDGVYITSSSAENLSLLPKYKRGRTPLPIDSADARENTVSDLVSVSAGGNYAGGIAGYLTSANVGGLLGNTLGLGQYLGFTVSDTTVTGTDGGYTVSAGGNCAGGGIGWAVGGDVRDVDLYDLLSVTASNRAGGFVGATGPGELVSGEGLDLQLLGISLLSINNLLSVAAGVRTTYTRANVNGIDDGFTVEETGSRSGGDQTLYTAGGFAAEANSVTVSDSHVMNLLSVTANDSDGIAGGFAGRSSAGGLAGILDDQTKTLDAVQVGQLLNAVPYLVPKYNGCDVTYVSGGCVEGNIAGGFTGEFQSGQVNTDTLDENFHPAVYETGYTYSAGIPDNPYSVNNIDHVAGRTYAGGFGGKVYSGALVSAGGGLSILGGTTSANISLEGLLGLVEAYVPVIKYAGINSPDGFVVSTDEIESDDPSSGSAGGFIGYASGAQVSYSDVNKLRHTIVVPPDDLEAVQADSYFDGSSSYAVTGGHYSGGYVGKMDIGTAASLGDGLKLLGNEIELTNVASALSVVVTTIEHSDVYGAPGGFAVIASKTDADDKEVGMAGGFAGGIYGGHIQDSHSINFSYIIGEENAGGYVGNMEPGDVASLLDDGSLLSNIVDIDSVLASVIEDFVPTIRNSTTTCIPCGGAVRAQAASDSAVQRGCAGGYCGHNEGGHIWGFNDSTWKDQNDGVLLNQQTDNNRVGKYTGQQSECAAIRIRSVYGYEYAGGFTGFMESGDTASLGSVSVLGDLIKIGNIVSLLKVVYPTEENTAVYGPLEKLDYQTWNSWVRYVGKYGGYGKELSALGEVTSQAQLDSIISDYIYGYNAVAGRTQHNRFLISEGGDAGGYVGLMRSGVITNGQAYDARLVKAMRSTGGFAGSMQTGGAANLGNVSILGVINLNLGTLVSALEVFVPAAKSSSVRGYNSGLTVISTGTDIDNSCGYAGGYVGSAYGAQIWGDKNIGDTAGSGCNVKNLRFVRGTNAVGGYAGRASAASAAKVDTNASNGFVQGILDSLVSNKSDLASVLEATVTTIRKVQTDPDSNDYGFVVCGTEGLIPEYSGGFVGISEAAVIGDKDGASSIKVNGLRNVDGGYYAGGFFGLADVTGVAEVSGEDETQLLENLISAGEVSLIDAFRTKIYYSEVNGTGEGITVTAHRSKTQSLLDETRYSGCAGGFGGAMMNGVVSHSKVTALNTVTGLNYTGGFIGHMGKSGVVDADKVSVNKLVGLTAGVFDIFSTHTDECEVIGIGKGAIIKAVGNEEPIAGGFVGYADVSKINTCKTESLKLVCSRGIAGGFVGKTDMHYLVNVSADSPLVQGVLGILNLILSGLLIDRVEQINLLDLNLGIADIQLLREGRLAYVNLLGLKVGVTLLDKSEDGKTGTALITIGDSSVALPFNENGIDTSGENSEVLIKLIKGNRTRINDSYSKGILTGYDVYAGGASYSKDGTDSDGYAGGFVGYNNEGRLLNDRIEYCDTVRGTPHMVGPFSGGTSLQSVYRFNTIESIEGENNRYPVYRYTDRTYAFTSTGEQIGDQAVTDQESPAGYKRFDIRYLALPLALEANEPYTALFEKWRNAVLASDSTGAGAVPIKVYESSAKAVLMMDAFNAENDQGLVPVPAEMKDPCDEKINITIQKIWNDRNDANGVRPDHIKVRIWQHYYNPDGTQKMIDDEPAVYIYNDVDKIPDIDSDGWFTISLEDHGQSGSAVWTRTIEGLPAAEYTTDSSTGEKQVVYYFSYTVEEQPVSGYTASVTSNSAGSEFTIINTRQPSLPVTGGDGDWSFVILGTGIILAAVFMFRRKKTVGQQGGKVFRPPRGSP